MNKRANLYFAALLGAMSPLCTVSALAAQSNSTIATATQQQNSCTGTVKDATGEPIIGATIRIEGTISLYIIGQLSVTPSRFLLKVRHDEQDAIDEAVAGAFAFRQLTKYLLLDGSDY